MDDKSRDPGETRESTAGVSEHHGTKSKWSKPVLVPLSIALTENWPGVGSDGMVIWPDSTHP